MKALLLFVVAAIAVVGFAYIGGFFNREAEKAGAGVTSLAIGVPSQATAVQVQSDVQAAVAAAQAYHAEHGGYAGMTITGLRAYDASLSGNLQLERADSAAYCIFETATTTTGEVTYSAHGSIGSAAVAAGGC